MKKIVYNHTLAYLLLFASFVTFGQKKYSPGASSAKLTLEGKSLVGYKTTFDFDWEEVRRGWWKYAREFGAPLNMRTYYKLNIPSETNDGNVNLVIFTQTLEVKGGAEFFLGLEDDRYTDQALTLIRDFKKKYYINDLVAQITEQQEKSDQLSKEYRDTTSKKEKRSLLQQITQIEKNTESLKEQIRLIERS